MDVADIERLARRGFEVKDELLERFRPDGTWRPGVWGKLIEALDDASLFAEECEAESVCAYVFLVEIVALHLEENKDTAHYKQLRSLLERHTLGLARQAVSMEHANWSEQEQIVLHLSMQGLLVVIAKLQVMYPGAS